LGVADNFIRKEPSCFHILRAGHGDLGGQFDFGAVGSVSTTPESLLFSGLVHPLGIASQNDTV
jgi:hypothetical protein